LTTFLDLLTKKTQPYGGMAWSQHAYRVLAGNQGGTHSWPTQSDPFSLFLVWAGQCNLSVLFSNSSLGSEVNIMANTVPEDSRPDFITTVDRES